VGGGGFVVQLGALRAQEDADKEWARLKKANADVLGALESDIMKVDIPGKGTFFRLRAGPLDEPGAKAACEELTKRKVGCIVAKK
jgi:cell division septation protein DedD